MQKIREFLVTTANSPDGIIYTYDDDTELFIGVKILQENMPADTRHKLIEQIKPLLSLFLNWAKMFTGCEVVEVQQEITFDMFWKKYDDASRSSKKRSKKIWDKYDKANQVKAYYYYDKYNRSRGNAEKKYCETYLAAEMWNN